MGVSWFMIWVFIFWIIPCSFESSSQGLNRRNQSLSYSLILNIQAFMPIGIASKGFTWFQNDQIWWRCSMRCERCFRCEHSCLISLWAKPKEWGSISSFFVGTSPKHDSTLWWVGDWVEVFEIHYSKPPTIVITIVIDALPPS